MSIFLDFLRSGWPRRPSNPWWIELWSPNGGQDGLCDCHVPGLGVRYVRYVGYTPLALGLSAF